MFAETPERATGACRPYMGKPIEIAPPARRLLPWRGAGPLKEGEWQQGPNPHSEPFAQHLPGLKRSARAD